MSTKRRACNHGTRCSVTRISWETFGSGCEPIVWSKKSTLQQIGSIFIYRAHHRHSCQFSANSAVPMLGAAMDALAFAALTDDASCVEAPPPVLCTCSKRIQRYATQLEIPRRAGVAMNRNAASKSEQCVIQSHTRIRASLSTPSLTTKCRSIGNKQDEMSTIPQYAPLPIWCASVAVCSYRRAHSS